MTEQNLDSPAPASIRFRRLVRHWGLVFALAIGFLFLAMCVREQPTTEPVESLGDNATVTPWH